MNTTSELLAFASTQRKPAQWARDLNVDPATLAQAKRRKHVSPEMAGFIAAELGLDVAKWVAVAALEAVKDSPAKARLLPQLQREVLAALRSTPSCARATSSS